MRLFPAISVPWLDRPFIELRLYLALMLLVLQRVAGILCYGTLTLRALAVPAPDTDQRAQAGDPAAMASLGRAYFHGEGRIRDPEQALTWFLKGAAEGNAAAQVGAGYMLSQGIGCRVNLHEAGKWFLRAAEQNDPKGQHNFAEMLAKGWLGPGRIKEAVDWYIKAGMQGQVNAQAALVDLFYFPGSGVPQNVDTAAFWAEKAAGAGHPHCQMLFGIMLRDGQGTGADATRAYTLFSASAGQGNTKAMCHLAGMLAAGDGTTKDPVQAGTWYLRAATLGEEAAKGLWEELKRSLTPELLKEIEQRSKKAG